MGYPPFVEKENGCGKNEWWWMRERFSEPGGGEFPGYFSNSSGVKFRFSTTTGHFGQNIQHFRIFTFALFSPAKQRQRSDEEIGSLIFGVCSFLAGCQKMILDCQARPDRRL